ncbi:cytochrome C oxidase subunit IV family protein [Runella sp.]|jgi:cytochrome c oxidase subunit IV|uniref:cytochrome C oxidase subunit IV family protein n=1 Tax=Runella sp. TaxID=1960881 RepID=UPI0026239C4E|nr:cytochrome C oxidase subunit IV family protein [Runella sp.]
MAHVHEQDANAGAEQRKVIWRTFWILLGITALEFAIAFTLNAGLLKTSIFVGMTIIKAFYIVGEFMHLKHEVKSLIWVLLIPCIFVVWLLIALISEGGSIFDLR